MAANGRSARFVDGLRVTDADTLRVVATSLKQLNGRLVKELVALGGRAAGIAGTAHRVLEARRLTIHGHDLGFVGQIIQVHPQPIERAARRGVIPVVWPLGQDHHRQLLNINADQAAAELAGTLKAEKLVLVTDVRGILRRHDEAATLIPTVKASEVEPLIARGVVVNGMIPKARACVHALRAGVRKTHMIDIKIPHGLLLEIFTDRGIGTEIAHSS